VAVWAYRPEFVDGVHLVARPDRGQLSEVVDVHEAASQSSIRRLEVEPADGAAGSPVGNARETGSSVALIAVDFDTRYAAFGVAPAGGHLLGGVEHEARNVAGPGS